VPEEDPRHRTEPAWWFRQGVGGKSHGRSRLLEVTQIVGAIWKWPFWLYIDY
jgi:hypothetical protein